MRHRTLVLVSLFLSTACGGPSREDLAERGLQHLEQITKLFDGIKDEATAKAALPQLEKLIDQMTAMNEEVGKMPKASPEQEAALSAKFSQRGQDAGMKMMQAAGKFDGNEKVQAILAPLMGKLGMR